MQIAFKRIDAPFEEGNVVAYRVVHAFQQFEEARNFGREALERHH
jgi:hypothetical protein